MRATAAPSRHHAQFLVLAGTLLLALPSDAYLPHSAAKEGGRFFPPAEAAALIEKGACEERSQPGTPIRLHSHSQKPRRFSWRTPEGTQLSGRTQHSSS